MASTTSDRRSWAWFLGITTVWILAYFGARVVLKLPDLETWQRVAVALAPLPPFVLFLVTLIRGVRSLDEMQRRIHLEALAFAFPLTMVLLMTLGLLELAIKLNPADWSYRHVWMFLPVFYFGGLALATRRYQ
jgi:hypothetical protein